VEFLEDVSDGVLPQQQIPPLRCGMTNKKNESDSVPTVALF
jgi:hypothetical protein